MTIKHLVISGGAYKGFYTLGALNHLSSIKFYGPNGGDNFAVSSNGNGKTTIIYKTCSSRWTAPDMSSGILTVLDLAILIPANKNQINKIEDFIIYDDGNKLSIVNNTENEFSNIYEFTLSTSYDLSSTIKLYNSYEVGKSGITHPTGITISPMAVLFVTSKTEKKIWRVDLTQ